MLRVAGSRVGVMMGRESVGLLRSNGVVTGAPVRFMSENIADGGMGRTMRDREHASEAVYFNKEDKELLKKLSKKLHAPTPQEMVAEASAIESILSKHGIKASKECIDELLAFKHHH
uniref:Uncharacterized protein n=1 Tax=Timspurckia oligopyrenoides TaxID=708627 RepID=A0A7S0ZJZ1_9RHOD|mmetsp:Transcript_797/g.1471  ORF Transcript_797/g.1471 Transcript_797/m.1471 type:complete len:117 (+) Transcript_797:72-422(+)